MSWQLLIRLTAPFAAVSVLVFLLGAAAAWYVNRLQTDLSDVLTVNVASVRAAEELEIGLHEIRGEVKEYLYTGDHAHLKSVERLRLETGNWLRRAEQLAMTPEEQDLIGQVRKVYEQFFAEFDRLPLERGDQPPAAALRALVDGLLRDDALVPAHAYLELNERMATQTADRHRGMAGWVMLLMLGLGACGAVAGLLACYGVARRITRTLAKLGVPIREAAGKLNAVAGQAPLTAGRDFEELESSLQKVAEQAGTVIARLHLSEREALRAEQLAAVGQMAAGLAHELRNPLMAMKMLIQPAAEAGDPAGLNREDLVVLNEEITRLDQSIQAFLDFARPPQPEKRPFDAAAVARQAVHLVGARAEQRGVAVECRAEGPLEVEADMVQFRQVMLNLLINALDATPEGGAVLVELSADGGKDGCLTVRVSDTGSGLPGELGERIFEPFVSTKDTGMGLGLSICKRILEAHGGRLGAEPRTGGGAVFTARLPLTARPPTEDTCRAETADRG